MTGDGRPSVNVKTKQRLSQRSRGLCMPHATTPPPERHNIGLVLSCPVKRLSDQAGPCLGPAVSKLARSSASRGRAREQSRPSEALALAKGQGFLT